MLSVGLVVHFRNGIAVHCSTGVQSIAEMMADIGNPILEDKSSAVEFCPPQIA
jgi:hypothetical protein